MAFGGGQRLVPHGALRWRTEDRSQRWREARSWGVGGPGEFLRFHSEPHGPIGWFLPRKDRTTDVLTACLWLL